MMAADQFSNTTTDEHGKLYLYLSILQIIV